MPTTVLIIGAAAVVRSIAFGRELADTIHGG
jgi:hypothetical protein